MVDANSHDELFKAREKYPPVLMKGNIYKATQFARIFIESNPHEAEIIHKISGKPVLCTTTNTMIGS